jgi:hypothetical protein
MGGMKTSDFSPGAILDLAERNPLVRACLVEWRKGSLTWEQALAFAVIHLAYENEKLLENAKLDPSPVVWGQKRET